MNWIKDHVALLVAVVILGGVLGVGYLFDGYQERGGTSPDRNPHAKACIEAGHTVRSHSQGVRETSYTFWCVTSDGQITDLWFE